MMAKTNLLGFVLASFLLTSNSLANELSVRYQGIPHDALYDICFVDDVGIAVGGFGVVLETNDGGLTWSKGEQFQDAALLGISCQQEQTFVVGQEGAIYVRQDGSWSQVDTPTQERLFSVSISQDGIGFVVGSFGTVLRSIDGGASWEALTPNWEAILNDFLEPHIYDVSISQSGVVTIVGEFSLIMQSHDSGDSWTVVNKADASLFGLSIDHRGDGFAVGQNGTVLKTTDGGASWQSSEIGAGGIFLDVWSSGHGEVVVSGIRQMLRSSDDGESWSSVQTGDVQTGWYQGIGVATRSMVQQQLTLEEERVFLAGHSGRIVEIN